MKTFKKLLSELFDASYKYEIQFKNSDNIEYVMQPTSDDEVTIIFSVFDEDSFTTQLKYNNKHTVVIPQDLKYAVDIEFLVNNSQKRIKNEQVSISKIFSTIFEIAASNEPWFKRYKYYTFSGKDEKLYNLYVKLVSKYIPAGFSIVSLNPDTRGPIIIRRD